MRTLAKFASQVVGFSLKNIRRIEVKFNPFHENAANIREFYQGVTQKRRSKTNPECIFRAQVVCDNSDPLVTIQFRDNHKLVLNTKHIESGDIVKVIRQFEQIHRNDPEDV